MLKFSVVHERIANACIDDPSRSFWAEVTKIRHGNIGNSIIIVDGCTNESAIAQLFASKYRSLYNSVSFDKNEIQYILNVLGGKVCDDKLYYSNCCFTAIDVSIAITELNSHKNDDSNAGLSNDHLIHAGPGISQHVSCVFPCTATHGLFALGHYSGTVTRSSTSHAFFPVLVYLTSYRVSDVDFDIDRSP